MERSNNTPPLSRNQIEMIKKTENIRNISLMGLVDHGRRTLTSLLHSKAEDITKNDKEADTEMNESEEEYVRRIRFTQIKSILYGIKERSQQEGEGPGLINLLTCAGYTDLQYEMSAMLRITDGVIVVLDAVQGFSSSFAQIIRRIVQEKMKPVLVINKVDRMFFELKLDGEQIYQSFFSIIEEANKVISNINTGDMGDLTLNPEIGNVAFGSAQDQWIFTLDTFARIYQAKFDIGFEKMRQKLWGENYFDVQTKQWTIQKSVAGTGLKRSFLQFIIQPICKLCHSILDSSTNQYTKMVQILQIQLSEQQKSLVGRKLLKAVMSKWLSADCLLKLAYNHLPSPVDSQRYRTRYLYDEPMNDPVNQSMKQCNPEGPLFIYISKMIRCNQQYFSLGRIFSGTLREGQKIRILGPKYQIGENEDVYEQIIKQPMVLAEESFQYLPQIPCGNIIILNNLGKYLLREGCIVDANQLKPFSMRTITPKITLDLKLNIH